MMEALKKNLVPVLLIIPLLLAECGQKRPENISSVMRSVCDWQLANLQDSTINRAETDRKEFIRPNGWIRAAFYSGVMAQYYTSGEKKYLDSVISWAKRNHYRPGPSPRHADDQAVGQVYAEMYFLNKNDSILAPTRSNFDLMIAEPTRGPQVGWSKPMNWSWCDALFMAPPGMARMGKATGQKKYFDLLDTLWWDTNEYLYDKDEHLYYRDANYMKRPDGTQPLSPSGKKIFWARGNGWVMAGLARTLQYLPEDYPSRPRYEALFRDMANEVLKYQQKDGLWRSSINDPAWYPAKETSSTGMFCYSFAWGINNGMLERNKFLPAALKAWEGLAGCVEPSGKLGYVQVTGHDPRRVDPDDNVDYGAGALLLAGSELNKIR